MISGIRTCKFFTFPARIQRPCNDIPPNGFIVKEGNAAKEWNNWLEVFNSYATATGLTELPDGVQVDKFLEVIGPECAEIYNSFNLTDEEKNNIGLIKRKFTEHFEYKPNFTVERYKFNQLHQLKDECFDNFLARIKDQSRKCAFHELSDALLTDRIIMGIKSEEIRLMLLSEYNLTLDKAIEICKADELQQQLNITEFPTELQHHSNVSEFPTTQQHHSGVSEFSAVLQPHTNVSEFPTAQQHHSGVSEFSAVLQLHSNVSEFPAVQQHHSNVSEFPTAQQHHSSVSEFSAVLPHHSYVSEFPTVHQNHSNISEFKTVHQNHSNISEFKTVPQNHSNVSEFKTVQLLNEEFHDVFDSQENNSNFSDTLNLLTEAMKELDESALTEIEESYYYMSSTETLQVTNYYEGGAEQTEYTNVVDEIIYTELKKLNEENINQPYLENTNTGVYIQNDQMENQSWVDNNADPGIRMQNNLNLEQTHYTKDWSCYDNISEGSEDVCSENEICQNNQAHYTEDENTNSKIGAQNEINDEKEEISNAEKRSSNENKKIGAERETAEKSSLKKKNVTKDNGEKRFLRVCKNCKKTYRTIGYYTAHKKKCAPFETLKNCPKCNKDIRTENEYRCHLLVCGKPTENYSCKKCNYDYKTLKDLEKHQRTKKCIENTAIKIDCDECDLSFWSIRAMRKHAIKTHLEVNMVTLDFSNFEEFNTWREKEQKTKLMIMSIRTCKIIKGVTHKYYTCRMSRPSKKRNKKIQRQGGGPVPFSACPSKILARIAQDGKVTVKYYPNHNHELH